MRVWICRKQGGTFCIRVWRLEKSPRLTTLLASNSCSLKRSWVLWHQRPSERARTKRPSPSTSRSETPIYSQSMLAVLKTNWLRWCRRKAPGISLPSARARIIPGSNWPRQGAAIPGVARPTQSQLQAVRPPKRLLTAWSASRLPRTNLAVSAKTRGAACMPSRSLWTSPAAMAAVGAAVVSPPGASQRAVSSASWARGYVLATWNSTHANRDSLRPSNLTRSSTPQDTITCTLRKIDQKHRSKPQISKQNSMKSAKLSKIS